MSKEIKQIRGQLRQIVKELLPELVTQELQTAMYKQLAAELSAKLSAIDAEIKQQLTAMSDRAKDMQSFLMREMIGNAQARPVTSAEDTEVKS